ncbi:MAG: aminotransferase class V-fold PLP-dependent enzyme [Candidatus Dormibacteraeota bacterium]|nr:aminotransferase class V-fold PLP-dependent enzyme [Candidatus Dormibacteraeota bacterium]MBV9525825.1 aminotransferase class V-fold PLP-dependent enzyme [Candidatus Dormibacteraeota bacterium]
MNPALHGDAPLLDALGRMLESPPSPFGIPGHKLDKGIDPAVRSILGERVFACDVSLDGQLDDRLATHGYDKRAEELIADAISADEVLLSTNGSTLAAEAAILGMAGPGDTILMTRGMHKSAVSALILGGATPVFLDPGYDDEQQLWHPVPVATLEAAVRANPNACAAFVVSPSSYGFTADIEGLAGVCHRAGIPLIVDEAWGVHLAFSERLPVSALAAGADVAVTSMHKQGTGLMQGSIIGIRKGRVDVIRLQQAVAMLESSSTSMLILAAVDGARRQFALRGEQLLSHAVDLAMSLRDGAAHIEGLRVLGDEMVGRPGVHAFDPTKVVIDVSGLDVSAFAVIDWLLEQHRMPCEMADDRHLVAMVTVADDDRSIGRLVDALAELPRAAAALRGAKRMTVPAPQALRTELAMSPREAYFDGRRPVSLQEAAGSIAAETAVPYPPGIPAILPGEVWTEALIDFLKSGVDCGMKVADAADPKLGTVLVVDR